MAELAACFASVLHAGPAPDEDALRSYVASARAAHPGLTVDDLALIRHAAARCDERGLQPVEHAGDLFLALGCLLGITRALTEFERAHGEVIARVLAHRRAEGLTDDVAQTVRERLLVGREGAPAKISGYRGTGPLRSWVAIATSTQLAMARRSAGRRREQAAEDEASQLIARDPELQYLQQRYRGDVEQAIVHGLRTLGERERLLLRLQLGERMTLEQLATMYTVDRATVARWLAKARSALAQSIRDELRVRTGANERTCEDLLRLVESQLDVSVLRHLS
jgi:RNA polymerase sigma-70 factor (ECF subfamily)